MAQSANITTYAALRDHVAGWRVLLVSNRCNSDVADQLTRVLGITCQIEDVSAKPRRRRALVECIEHGSYDVVLIAHGFVAHGDTRSIAAACRRAKILYIAVGKGRTTEILTVMQAMLPPKLNPTATPS